MLSKSFHATSKTQGNQTNLFKRKEENEGIDLEYLCLFNKYLLLVINIS